MPRAGGSVPGRDARRLGRDPVDTRGRAERLGDWVVGHPWVFLIAVGLAAFGWWAKGTREEAHQVRAVFTTAPSVYSGLDVRVDGLDAGKVTKVENVGGRAVITLGLKDNRFWPLRQGTTATLRFGSTIGNGTRIIDLQPSRTGGVLPENGIIDNTHTVEATEFDDLFNTFDTRTRKALQGTLKGTADTFGNRSEQLGQGVAAAGPGLAQVGGLASDLAADGPALRAFVVNTDRVTRTLAARQGAVSDLVSVAAATFNAFARNTTGIRESLDRFAPALQESRTTLARLDGSVGHLDNLVADLAPGARKLAPMARQLRPALAQLRETVPGAVDAFRTGRRIAPELTGLLQEAPPFAAKAAPALTGLNPVIGCIRPYAPDISGLLVNWTSFNQGYDDVSHYGRIWGNVGATSVTSLPSSVTSKQWTQLTGEKYALIRPPGLASGTPWYQPQCGAGPEVLDPANDPTDKSK